MIKKKLLLKLFFVKEHENMLRRKEREGNYHVAEQFVQLRRSNLKIRTVLEKKVKKQSNGKNRKERGNEVE